MAKQFNYEVYVKNLPDSYRKTANSNNHRILTIEKESLDGVKADASAIYDSLDIWKATGKTLDLYGEMYKQPRENLGDDEYRAIILLKIAQNKAGSDHTSIINSLSGTLGISPKDFRMVDSETSGNVEIDFPYDALQASGVSPQKTINVLNDILGAGIGISRVSLSHNIDDIGLKIAAVVVHDERNEVHVQVAE